MTDSCDEAMGIADGTAGDDEHSAQVDSAASAMIAEDDAASGSQSQSAKRKRGAGPEMAEILTHFVFVEKRASNNYHQCRYCLERWQSDTLKFQEGHIHVMPQQPTPMRQRHRPMEQHLKNCKNYQAHKRTLEIGWTGAGVPSTPAAAGTALGAVDAGSNVSSLASPAMKQPPLSQHFMRSLTATEKDFFHECLLEFVVDAALPFSVVERPSFRRVVDLLRPGVSKQLPGRQAFSNNVLTSRYETAVEGRNKTIKDVCESGRYLGLLVDGWETIAKAPLEGVIIRAGTKSFLLAAKKPPTDHHAIAIAKMWEGILITDARPFKGNLKYFLSDDASYCRRARSIMALRHPFLFFNKCWAHQVNLMVGHLMKKTKFASASNRAVKAANAIRASHSKWYAKLREICVRLYGYQAASTILGLAETRWNSLQGVFASQLRIRTALGLLHAEFHNESRWPKACDTFKDADYFTDLAGGEKMIRPFCNASFLMQKKENTLAEVLVMLVNLSSYLVKFLEGEEDVQSQISDLTMRWRDAEQPLFVLCFCLHPKYRIVAAELLKKSEDTRGKWAEKNNPLTAHRLVEAACFYFKKHRLFADTTNEGMKKELKHLRVQSFIFLRGSIDEEKLVDFERGMDPCTWYDHNEDLLGTPLASFAKFLLCAPCQGASCERMFKEFSRQMTKSRNRLSHKKLAMSAMIKYDLKKDDPKVDLSGLSSSRNRFLSPLEHPRVDSEASGTAPALPPNVGAPEPSDSDEELIDWDDTALPTTEIPIPEEYDDPELRAILTAIQQASPSEDMLEGVEVEHGVEANGDDSEDSDDDDDLDLEALAEAHQQRTLAQQREDPPEEAPDELEPLPDHNDMNYPQENAEYFATKKYCRKDKYKLEWFIMEGVSFPSIKDAFST